MADQTLKYYCLKLTPVFSSASNQNTEASGRKTDLMREQARRYDAFKQYAESASRVFKDARRWAWEWWHTNKTQQGLSVPTLRLAAYQAYIHGPARPSENETLDIYYFIINSALEEGIVAAKNGEQRPPVSARTKVRIPLTSNEVKVDIRNLCVRIPGAPEVYLKKALPQDRSDPKNPRDFHIQDVWLVKPVNEWALLVSSNQDVAYIPGHSGKQPTPYTHAAKEEAPRPTIRRIEGVLPASRGVDAYMENARKIYALARGYSRDYMANLPPKKERLARGAERMFVISGSFKFKYERRLAQNPGLARTTYLHGLEDGIADFQNGTPFDEHAPFDGFFRIMFGRPVVVKKSGTSFTLPALGEVNTQAAFFEGAKILKVFARKADNGWVLLIHYVDTHSDALLDIM
jgi:hypothetical protein